MDRSVLKPHASTGPCTNRLIISPSRSVIVRTIHFRSLSFAPIASPHPGHRPAPLAPFLHNGTVFRVSLPLWNVPFCRTIDTGLLGSIASHDPFHNGTVSRILLPLWNILMDFPLLHSFGMSSLSVHLPDSFQRSNGNENHPKHEKRTIPRSTPSEGVAFSRISPTP